MYLSIISTICSLKSDFCWLPFLVLMYQKHALVQSLLNKHTQKMQNLIDQTQTSPLPTPPKKKDKTETEQKTCLNQADALAELIIILKNCKPKLQHALSKIIWLIFPFTAIEISF